MSEAVDNVLHVKPVIRAARSPHRVAHRGEPGKSILESGLTWQKSRFAGAMRWHLNTHVLKRLRCLEIVGARLTVLDVFATPGDTLLTAIVCRHIKKLYPRLRLNCLTANPAVIERDPHIDTINEPETYFSLWSWYPNLEAAKRNPANVLSETFDRIAVSDFTYEAEVYLGEDELAKAREQIGRVSKPILTFHLRSREKFKEWRLERWLEVISALRDEFHLIHLGDEREPDVAGVHRFAGRLSIRESMAVLAHASVHAGADSFLMHAANGLDVPSVIVFGGSRSPANLGYADNINLFVPMPCGPCWLHSSNGGVCEHNIACMDEVRVEQVVAAIRRQRKS